MLARPLPVRAGCNLGRREDLLWVPNIDTSIPVLGKLSAMNAVVLAVIQRRSLNGESSYGALEIFFSDDIASNHPTLCSVRSDDPCLSHGCHGTLYAEPQWLLKGDGTLRDTSWELRLLSVLGPEFTAPVTNGFNHGVQDLWNFAQCYREDLEARTFEC